ncbi:hypothetical protein ACFL6H_08055 [Candidatus Latescibacterota bacterium]
MKKRPTSLTVIAWIMIIMSGISLISSTVSLMNPNPMLKEIMERNPIPIPIQLLLSYLQSLAIIVTGIAILKGKNWARFLYIIWSAIGFILFIPASPIKIFIIPHLVIFLIVVFILFRSPANNYFKGMEVIDDTESN